MLDTITFVDLVALTRITPDSTVEKFGGLINSSFFDASNILGTLKQRNLIDFVTSFPSQSAITVTDQGKQLIAEAQERAASPFDTLDMEILIQLSKGNRSLPEVNAEVNVTSKDLAVHLYKLSQQQFLSYELRNGSMTMTLTEKGFLRVREGVPKTGQEEAASAIPTATTQPTAAAPTQTTKPAASIFQPAQTAQSREEIAQATMAQSTDVTSQMAPPIQAAEQPKTYDELHQLEAKIVSAKRTRTILTIILVVIVAVVILLLYLGNII